MAISVSLTSTPHWSDGDSYIRLYTEANYPIWDIAKQCKTSVSTLYKAMVAAGFTEFRSKHSRASLTRMSMEQQAIANILDIGDR